MLSKPAQVGDIFSAWAARSLIPSSSVTCDKKKRKDFPRKLKVSGTP